MPAAHPFIASPPADSLPSCGVRVRGWIVAATAAALGVLGVRAVIHFRTPPLGALEVRPAAMQLSVRVGDHVEFVASAPGAVETVWSLWGRRVGSGPMWSYDPGPEDAGWQQVSVQVRGGRGDRTTRTWDLGVDAVGVPEIASLDPPAGPLTLEPGVRPALHARARVAAARASDRLVFEWSMDDRPILRDEQPAADGTSEVRLPPVETGSHRVRLRVTEDGRTASIADWAIDARPSAASPADAVAEDGASELALATTTPDLMTAAPPMPEPPPTEAVAIPPAPEPPAPAAPPVPEPALPAEAVPPTPEPTPPATRLVRVPEAAQLDATVGVPLVLAVQLDPARKGVSHRWVIDGEPARARGARLTWTPRRAGTHRVAVTAVAGRKALATDDWIVVVRATAPTPAPAPTETVAVAEPAPQRVDVVRVPDAPELEGDIGVDLPLEARVAAPVPHLGFRWAVDGRSVPSAHGARYVYAPGRAGRHRVAVSLEAEGRVVGRAAWIVAVKPVLQPVAIVTPEEAPSAPAALAEADVRQWLVEYARAWSRKDVASLRRMGQVHSPAEADQLDRYFHSIGTLDVDVHVLSLTIDGPHATVEFERVDTVTDPGGRRQELRLPPMRKRIERTPDGLRFADATGAG